MRSSSRSGGAAKRSAVCPIGQVRRGGMPHRAVVQLFQMIAPLVIARAVLPVKRQMIHHHVAAGLVAIPEHQRDPRGMLETRWPGRRAFCERSRLCWWLNLPFQVVRQQVPKLRVYLDQPGNIGQILDPLALPPLRVAPGLDLSPQRVFQRGHSQENAVNVGRNRSGGKLPIEILRAELQTDLRAALEVDGPLESLGLEAGRLPTARQFRSMASVATTKSTSWVTIGSRAQWFTATPPMAHQAISALSRQSTSRITSSVPPEVCQS